MCYEAFHYQKEKIPLKHPIFIGHFNTTVIIFYKSIKIYFRLFLLHIANLSHLLIDQQDRFKRKQTFGVVIRFPSFPTILKTVGCEWESVQPLAEGAIK